MAFAEVVPLVGAASLHNYFGRLNLQRTDSWGTDCAYSDCVSDYEAITTKIRLSITGNLWKSLSKFSHYRGFNVNAAESSLCGLQ